MGQDQQPVPEEDWLTELWREAWSNRPYARTFDLISSQYGWTDSQILDLTLSRLRQVRDVIFERQREEKRDATAARETDLQVLVGAIHAANGNASGAKAAAKLELQKKPKIMRRGSFEAVLGMFGDEGLPGPIQQE